MTERRTLLKTLFETAVAAAQPERFIAGVLPEQPKGRTLVVGAGKGSAQMARALEAAWDGPLEGLVVTRYGYGTQTRQIEIVEAAHPVPDAAGAAAAKRLLHMVQGLTADDLVIALISGGGSALLPAPARGLTLEDEIDLNTALLSSGAPISAMNAIRKQFSLIKGGRLARAAFPARVVSLVVSDVPGDDPALVASGPTVPDATTRQEARRLVALYGISLNARLRAVLEGEENPAPHPDDPAFAGQRVKIVASAAKSLEAAAAAARQAGYQAAILSDAMEGEAKDVGQVHAVLAREIALRDRPFGKPVVLLSGGETTVTLTGTGGRGGRNSAFLLAFAIAVDGLMGVEALAADTDGIDGTEDNAGAFADGGTVTRMRAQGIDPQAMLAGQDSYGAFAGIDDLFVPGPTGTNVNDFRAILIA